MYTLAICLTLLAPAPKEAPKKEPPTIVGKWVAESVVLGGKADPAPTGMTMSFTKEGKCMTKEGKDVEETMGYAIDASKSPGHLDMIENPGPNQVVMRGIYKIEGETLTICLSPMGNRPVEFASIALPPTILLTLKKQKKE